MSSIEVENQNRKKERLRLTVLSISGMMIFLALWQISVGFGWIPKKFLAPPTEVLKSFAIKFYDTRPDGSTLLVHFISSFYIALVGFTSAVVIGTPLGLLMGYYKVFDKLVKPVFELIRPIPPIAWIPLSVLWLGIGTTAKSYIIFLAAFVPCVINSYTGVRLTNPVLINVAKTCGASKWKIFIRVCVPSALPLVFTGIRIALGNAWSTLVAAELLASTAGLGYMIQQGRSLVRPDIIIVGMLTIGLTGALMAFAVGSLENKVVPWRVRK
ncbi:MAG: ABC transporter permease [Clostridia bacterium BRH_c25]|nr:MAG: ABC transporter permease [Clostridia bacterium BRH_c25]